MKGAPYDALTKCADPVCGSGSGDPSTSLLSGRSSHAFLELTEDGLLTLDSELTCLEVNPAICRMLGHSEAEMLELRLADITTPESFASLHTGISSLRQESLMTGNWLLRSKDGSPVAVNGRIKKLTGEMTVCALREVTDEQATLMALRETEDQLDRFKAVPQGNPNPIVRIDQNGTLLMANPAALRHFSELSLAVGNPAPTGLVEIARKVLGGDTSSSELSIGQRTFLINGSRSDEERSVNLYAIDITARKLAEQALRLSEKRYRTLIDQALDALFVVEQDTLRFVETNPAAHEMLGYSREELLGMTAFDVVAPTDIPRIPAEVELLKKGGESRSEWDVIRKDGTTFPGEIVARQLPDGRIQGFIRDITERNRADHLLRESEARLRGALNSLMEGCQIIGFDWAYLFVNPAAARHGRRKQEDFIGRTIHDLYPGIEHTAMFTALSRAMHMRIPSEFENEFSYPDGTVAQFEIAVQPVPEGIFILSHDITEKRLLEEQVIRASDMEQQRIGRDIHDGVGQQLTAISLLHNLLQRELADLKSPAVTRAERISGLIAGVSTDIRRISHGLQPVSDDSQSLIAALEQLTSNVAGASCRFECPAPADTGDAVVANHLYRIAQEAVQNAIRHGKPDSITVRLLSRSGLVVLEIEDDGFGFDQEDARLGIGLHTMKYRARAVKGSLQILPQPHGGTLIRCTVPVREGRSESPPRTHSQHNVESI